MRNSDQNAGLLRRSRLRLAAEIGGLCGLIVLVAVAAIITKEAVSRSSLNPLAAMGPVDAPAATVVPATTESNMVLVSDIHDPLMESSTAEPAQPAADEPVVKIEEIKYASSEIRYFNGRPVRPAKTIRMTVTAYSPDEKSCPGSADGITSSIHSVWTNAMKMAAADSKILPLGTMISVPGYDDGNVIPVLDRGGAIKGNRLDVLYATDSQARKWGVKKLEVVVWEYADGLPADDFRAIRDSKN